MQKPVTEKPDRQPLISPPSSYAAYHKRGQRRWTLGASFGYALSGLWYAVRTQLNMRIHLSVSAAVLVVGLYVGLSWTQWAVLVLTIGAVLIAELFNTVAEAALDAATSYYHPLIKIAKDVAAGAVLLTALLSVVVGLLILGPPLYAEIAAWLEPAP